jgi:4-carboxymuconolactone decarboxylase
MNHKLEEGLRVFGEMTSKERAEKLGAKIAEGGFGSRYYQLAVGVAFGDVWSRPGLSRRERSLLTIGAAVEMRDVRVMTEHIAIGMNHGLTPAEIEEALIQLLPYAGFPAVATAIEIAGKVIAERAE